MPCIELGISHVGKTWIHNELNQPYKDQTTGIKE